VEVSLLRVGRGRDSRVLAGLLLLGFAARSAADDPPHIEHQPSPCTIPEKPISLCATVTDDGQVAKARIYFKPAGDKFYSFVEMVFGGINFCGTLPAPHEGKVKVIEYYVQATDDQFQAQRTSTYQMNVQPEGQCEFPPLEKDPARGAAVRVYATNKKQGKKTPEGFQATGVSFIPLPDH
jgi:hypothetical protein